MITSKSDLKDYIEADKKANRFTNWSPITNTRCKFLRTLRKLEFLRNTHASRILIFIDSRRLQSLSERLGITSGPNCFGKGLYIPHYGSIVVNGTARFGDNCIVQNGVNLSESVVCGGGVFI